MNLVHRNHRLERFNPDRIEFYQTVNAQVNVIGYGLCEVVSVEDNIVVIKPPNRSEVPIHKSFCVTAEWRENRK